MLRATRIVTITDSESFKKNLFFWAKQFETAVWLDTNEYVQKYGDFDCALAVDEFTAIKTDFKGGFDTLKEYQSHTKDYIFGYIAYDVKNDVEDLTSKNFDGLYFPDIYFFQPQKLIFLKGNVVEFHYLHMIDDEIDQDFVAIQEHQENHNECQSNLKDDEVSSAVKIKLRMAKDEYHQKVAQVIEHIRLGDIYEANFCQEFYAENTTINPYAIYAELNAVSRPPFATFFRHENLYLLSATPERYIKKEGKKIISQPIKGTAKRMVNQTDDAKIAFDLSRDEKERAENIMIVDLVRNDLSRTATKGSVRVEELCKVYSFEQVHQLISTVTSEISAETHPVDVIRNTFPMGSMTGAPKISAMQIIEDLENTKRGLYSGTVGYFTPDGDFDFNVVIRSILYNEETNYVSFSVGSAITSKSIPEKEYEECLLKAKAMRIVLSNS